MNIRIAEDKEYINSILNLYPFFLNDHVKDGNILLKCTYAGEIRMGPPYYQVEVFNSGQQIFRDAIYGGEIFCENILSEKHNRLILVKWFSQKDPYDQVVVSINLSDGKEVFLTDKYRYFTAGHFDSFDGFFCSKFGIKDIFCENFETREKFMLTETLNKHIKAFHSWGLSPIKNTITVLTKEKKDNVIIYNLKDKKIENACTMHFDLSENGSIRCFLDKKNETVLFEFDDYDLLNERRIVNQRKYYKILEM